MPGINRFAARSSNLTEKFGGSLKGPCVFISHQFIDFVLARKVGGILKDLELDIWLDEEDSATQQAVASGDKRKLAEAIEMGLSTCTHLLALISAATRESWWVPYEIGSVRGRTKPLAFFVHKEVRDLPEYLVFGKRILDQHDFYAWAKEISSGVTLTESRANLQKSAAWNPLADLLPPFRSG